MLHSPEWNRKLHVQLCLEAKNLKGLHLIDVWCIFIYPHLSAKSVDATLSTKQNEMTNYHSQKKCI